MLPISTRLMMVAQTLGLIANNGNFTGSETILALENEVQVLIEIASEVHAIEIGATHAA